MLLADYNAQIDGLALLGSGSSGQPSGIMPAGALGAATMINLQNTNNGSSQQWAYGGTTIAGSPHYAAAQLLSKLGTYRAQRPNALDRPRSWWSQLRRRRPSMSAAACRGTTRTPFPAFTACR